MSAFESRKVENDDSAIGSTGHEPVVGQLKLANEGGVTLKKYDAIATNRELSQH